MNNEEHGLRTSREEIAFTERPRIQSQSQILRYGRSIFCLPHRPTFSDIFDLCLHWVSVVRDEEQWDFKIFLPSLWLFAWLSNGVCLAISNRCWPACRLHNATFFSQKTAKKRPKNTFHTGGLCRLIVFCCIAKKLERKSGIFFLLLLYRLSLCLLLL